MKVGMTISKRLVVWLALFILTGVLASYLFIIPKQLFRCVQPNEVVSVEHRYTTCDTNGEPGYIEIPTSARNRIAESLHNLKVTRQMSKNEIAGEVGGVNPVRVTLKSGYSFYYSACVDYIAIYFEDGEYAGMKPVNALYFKVADKNGEANGTLIEIGTRNQIIYGFK